MGRATHRAIAARAGVPLGATTYYFPTLADLVAAGLQQAADAAGAELAAWAEVIDDADDLPRVLPELLHRYLADRSRALLEYDLYLAAARDPHLRPLAQVWLQGARDLVSPYTGAATAAALVALLDGAILQSLVTGDDVDQRMLQAAIARLIRSSHG